MTETQILLAILAYLALFVLTWGAVYGFFRNEYSELDSNDWCRRDRRLAVTFAVLQPLGFIVALFVCDYFKHGFQWRGGPRSNPTLKPRTQVSPNTEETSQ